MTIIATRWAWVAFCIRVILFELMSPSYLFLGYEFCAIVTGITLAPGVTMSAKCLMLPFIFATLISWVLLRQVFKFPTGKFKPLITISTTMETYQLSRQRFTIG
jgi:membrane protein implicated in regulation of membrane protease activity